MSIIIDRFQKIKSNIDNFENTNHINVVAVSKTFTLDHIMPLIEHGHCHYGENKVQEAEAKWRDIKQKKKDLKLHMIGKLQSNKAKKAVELFDYIHSLDNQKLADVISKHQSQLNRSLKYFKLKDVKSKRIEKVLKLLMKKYDASEDQLLLSWIMNHPLNILPVIGTTKKERIKAAIESLNINLDKSDWFSLLVASQGYKVP